jgi:hypothetical protein
MISTGGAIAIGASAVLSLPVPASTPGGHSDLDGHDFCSFPEDDDYYDGVDDYKVTLPGDFAPGNNYDQYDTYELVLTLERLTGESGHFSYDRCTCLYDLQTCQNICLGLITGNTFPNAFN